MLTQQEEAALSNLRGSATAARSTTTVWPQQSSHNASNHGSPATMVRLQRSGYNNNNKVYTSLSERCSQS